MHLYNLFFILSIFLSTTACQEPAQQTMVKVEDQPSAVALDEIIPGAYQTGNYISELHGKKIAVIVNQTSQIAGTHLVDSLLALKMDLKKIFAPEHGFRGTADAGQKLNNSIDPETRLPIISLYGKHKKPSKKDLEGIDHVIFDIQDVGVRFYTYISTLHLVMEACAEYKIPVTVLDRPNPNGHYIDGPILEKELQSFVGMHPVPIVYGMTIGEYALMINGESWLSNNLKCTLNVIPCINYNHNKSYDLPVKPSPNLPNRKSILLYPSLCLFEGTTVSVGRGTNEQFQQIGHPDWKAQTSFTPVSGPGAKHPKHEGKVCGSIQLNIDNEVIKNQKQINLSFLIQSYQSLNQQGSQFFNDNNFFDKLAGTYELRKQLETPLSMEQIRASWQPGITEFKKTRAKYLLYQ